MPNNLTKGMSSDTIVEVTLAHLSCHGFRPDNGDHCRCRQALIRIRGDRRQALDADLEGEGRLELEGDGATPQPLSCHVLRQLFRDLTQLQAASAGK